MKRKEMIMTDMTTTMTLVREVDLDELAGVEGGTYGDGGPWCGTHNPGWHPPLLQ